MILKNLTLKNYRRFKNLNLDFVENITAFIGQNGSGKTTIFEAILYALFGTQMVRTGKEGIKADFADSKEECQVNLTFKLDEQEYRIERRIKGKNSVTSAFVFTPEKGDQPVAERESGVNQYIQKLLGMNPTTFKISVFSAQKELNKFSSLSAEPRKKEIRKLLNVDLIRKAIDYLRADIRDNQKIAEGIASQQKGTQEIKEKIIQLKTAINEQKKQSAQFTQLYQQLQLRLKKQKVKINLLEKVNQENSRLDKQKSVIWTEIKNVRQNLAQTETRITNLLKKKNQLDVLAAIKQRYHQAKLRRANFDQSNLAKEIEQLKKKSESKLADFNQQKNILAKTTQQGRNLKAELAKIQQKLAKIKKLGRLSSCPECGRPLKDHYDLLVDKFSQEMRMVEKKVKEKRQEYQAVQKKAEAIEKERLIINQKIELKKSQLSTKKQRLDQQLAKLEIQHQRFIALESQLSQLPQLEKQKKQLQINENLLKHESAKVLKQIKQLGFNQQQFEKEKNILNQLQEQSGEKARKIEEIKGNIKARQINLKNYQNELKSQNNLKKQIKTLVSKNRLLSSLELLLQNFEKDLLARIRPILEKETSHLLQIITRNKYSSIELDSNYEIQLYDKGKKYQIKRFSGGEEDLVNLCFRLALARVIAEKKGSRRINFLILDEIFASQDNDRRQSILAALQGLSTQFRQLFLTTHVIDIKDQMPIVYEVFEATSRQSKIRMVV